jgi:hypothetical protein
LVRFLRAEEILPHSITSSVGRLPAPCDPRLLVLVTGRSLLFVEQYGRAGEIGDA